MTLYQKALDFATKAHGDQKRKYTNEPYINHPVAVANLLKDLGYSEPVLCAAILHDVVEDTDVMIEEIRLGFGDMVAILVDYVTDVYTAEDYPNLNRAIRKSLECKRLAMISETAKSIKLADLIDNTSSIVERDHSFAKVYLREKEEMLKVLTGGDKHLMDLAFKILKESKLKLGI